MIGQSYARTVLSNEEIIQFVQRPHWFVYVPAVLWMLVLLIGWILAIKIIITNISFETLS